MKFAAKTLLLPALLLSLGSPAPGLAQAPALNTLAPYVCDPTGDYVGDYSSTLIDDNGHIVLQVRSFENLETTFYCTNAGAYATLSHQVPMNSISAWVQTKGGVTPADVYVEIYVVGNPNEFYFNTTDAIAGPVSNGYRLYTWTPRSIDGAQGFPNNPQIQRFGFTVNVYNVGLGLIGAPELNGHAIHFEPHTIRTCPFSTAEQCANPPV